MGSVPLPSFLPMEQVIKKCVAKREDTRKDTQLAFGDITHGISNWTVGMLKDFQSRMVFHGYISGHTMSDCMIIVVTHIIVHVLLGEDFHLLHLWEQTITVNQELLTGEMMLPIISMIHCGTGLVASQASAAATLLSHGFIVN